MSHAGRGERARLAGDAERGARSVERVEPCGTEPSGARRRELAGCRRTSVDSTDERRNAVNASRREEVGNGATRHGA